MQHRRGFGASCARELRAVAWVLASCAGVLGCSKLLGLDEYGVSAENDGGVDGGASGNGGSGAVGGSAGMGDGGAGDAGEGGSGSVGGGSSGASGDSGSGGSSGESGMGGSSGTGGSGAFGGSAGVGTGGSGGRGGSSGGDGTGGAGDAGGLGGLGGTSGAGGLGGTSGAGGLGGFGGSAGAGGTAGISGNGGLGGSAGSGGVAGSGGSAGAGGVGGSGTLPACAGQVFTPEWDVVRSCILRAGCNPFGEEARISACITEHHQRGYPEQECTLGATSCADIEACYGEGFATKLCPSNTRLRCEGTRAIDCDPPDAEYAYFIDCAKYGGTCDVSTGVAECRVKASGCTATQDKYFCDGSVLYNCFDNKGYGYDCAAFGATCDETTPGKGKCVYPVEACGADSTSCSQDNAQICRAESLTVFHCGEVGLGCTTLGEPYCLAPGCLPVDHTDCSERCTAETELEFCYGGARVRVDCRDYGFERCDAFTDGSAECAGEL